MTSGNKKIVVAPEGQGMRLDIFLASRLDQTRAKTQKLIKDRLVLVNEKSKTPHYQIKSGDKIVVKKPKQVGKELKEPEVEIIFQNKDFVVVNKPAGLIVHPPHEDYAEPTLTDILIKKFPEIKKVGEKHRPGIVHRLDKEVSGLMVVARNNISYEYLKNEFRAQNIKKIYTGLVHGKTKNDFGEISFKVARKTKGGKMVARPQSQIGKEALTFWRVLKRFKNYTLLEVELKTGRTHQIRVHFKAIGHPLAGDPLYKTKKIGKVQPPRLFLHSTILGFYNLNKEWMEFKSELPQELNNFLQTLKS
jgi:23S rRNA pseudouridine1911/1915/1917 synthase